MESVVIDRAFWRGRRVFLTGHTGFKGAWTSLLLSELGAEVFGYALEPVDAAGIFSTSRIEADIHHQVGDVRATAELAAACVAARPSVVIHMAAQALVQRSYAMPAETYATNVMGTVNLLEAVRLVSGIDAVVIVTSDKCYENTGRLDGYKESDRLGGRDPYSNSKACAELITAAYRQSFFAEPTATRIASARAGNVIGGGDWARDRLVPDAMRAFFAREPLRIRNPLSVRPWQYVLDPVIGYLVLAEKLAAGGVELARGWNFGPAPAGQVSVEAVADKLVAAWGLDAEWTRDRVDSQHEAAVLTLDCSNAEKNLGWRPLVDLDQAIALTVTWYRALSEHADMRAVSRALIDKVLQLTLPDDCHADETRRTFKTTPG